MPVRLEVRDRSKLIAITSTLMLEDNDKRVWATFVNQGGNNVWLRLGVAAVADTGKFLTANGGNFVMDMATTPWYGKVYAIADGVASIVVCEEVMEQS